MSQREAEMLARLEQLNGRLQRDLAQSRREGSESDDRRADAARKGELGDDWRTIQRRIDAGQTTLAAVFGGQDESPEAQRLLGRSQRTLEAQSADLPIEVREELAAQELEHEQLLLRTAGGVAIVPPEDPEEPEAPHE